MYELDFIMVADVTLFQMDIYQCLYKIWQHVAKSE
jgi:hypothetical protein